MINENIILERLKKLRNDYMLDNDTTKKNEINGVINSINEWVNKGKEGNFPVDLSKWGIEFKTDNTQYDEASKISFSELEEDRSDENKITSGSEDTIDREIGGQETPSSNNNMALPTNVDGSDGNNGHHKVLSSEKPEQELPVPVFEEDNQDHSHLEIEQNDDAANTVEIERIAHDINTNEHAGLVQARLDVKETDNVEKLKEAINLCDEICSNSTVTSLHSEAIQIRMRAEDALTRLLEKFVKEGQEALRNDDKDAARIAFQRVSVIDSTNEIARNALRDLDSGREQKKEQNELSRQGIISLLQGLTERNDIVRLEMAIRECESRQIQGLSLPDELRQRLPDARSFFDKRRQEDGQVITQARSGLLSDSKRAISYFEDLSVKGNKNTIDPLLGTRSLSEAIAEANAVWKQRSGEFLQTIRTKIQPFLPARPRDAMALLDQDRYETNEQGEKNLRPFHQDAAIDLEKIDREIRDLLTKLDLAENLDSQAAKEDDPIKAFKLLQQTRDAFKYLEGIDLKIENARQTALQYLLVKIEDEFASARTALKFHKFVNARNSVTRAVEMGSTWVSQPVPDELTQKLAEAQSLREKIDDSEVVKTQFDQLSATIRQYKDNKSKLPEAFRLLDSLEKDERFKVFESEMRQLLSEMDPLRGVDDKIEKAQLSFEKGDWQRTLTITNELLSGTKLDANLQKIVKQLHLDADMEMKIIEAQEYIEKYDIPKANEIVSRLIHPSSQLHEIAASRLKAQIELINDVIQNNPPWKRLFEMAETEAIKPGYEHQLNALRIFHYINGKKNVRVQSDWPVYRLSLKTAEAGTRAGKLSEELRKTALKEIKDAYNSRDNGKLDSVRIRYLAEIAVELRHALVLQGHEENNWAQWFEIERAKLEHAELAELGSWDKIVTMWEELEDQYPRQITIQEFLKTARIQQTISRVDMDLRESRFQDALEIIWKAQRNPELNRSYELSLKLCEIYAGKEEFDKVFDILDEMAALEKYAELAVQKKAEYQKEQKTLEFQHQAESEWDKKHYQRALEILLVEAKDEQIKDDKKLTTLASTLYTRRAGELISTISDQEKIGTYSAKIDLMNAALELRRLEEMMGVDERFSRALNAIKSLKGELPGIASNLIRMVHRYTMNGMHLSNVLDETRDVLQKLQALKSIKDHFSGELEEQQDDLERALQVVRGRLGDLVVLNTIIERTRLTTLWEDAVIGNKFSTLESIKTEIEKINMDGVVEIDTFVEKFNEYRGLSKYFRDICDLITKNFAAAEEENFEEVIRLITQLRSRPNSYRMENREFSFRQITQGDYALIYDLIGNHFNLVDLYSANGKNLIGWQVIIQAAECREKDYLSWKKWTNNLKIFADKANTAYHFSTEEIASNPSIQLRRKINDWKTLLDILEEGVNYGSAFPRNSDEIVPVQSNKASRTKKGGIGILDSLNNMKKYTETQINELEKEISSKGGFPTTEEVLHLSKIGDWKRLEKRYSQAKEIGPDNENEEKRIRMMENMIKNGNNPSENKGFFEKLLSWLRDLFGG